MSFFGGGTDMESFFRENGGAVLSTTFDKYCYVNVRHLPRFFDYSTELSYSKTERVTCIEDIQHPAILNAMKMLDMHEIRLTYEADLPARSGLGTSSSFAVGMLNAFYALKGKYADKKKLADEAIYLERNLCQEAGGWQDQIAASFGGFNRINFNADGYEVLPVIIAPERKKQLNKNLMMFFTGFTRFSSDVQKANAAGKVDKTAQLKEMLALVDEAEKVLVNKEQDLDDFGRMLDHTWKLKRQTGSAVSTNSIDELYAKGTIIIECGKMLSDAGYKIKVLNTINFKKSMRYNPFHYIRSEKDILKLVNTIIANTKGDGEKSGEDFWIKAERLLYCALIGYIWYEAPEEEQNFSTLLEFINASEAREDDEEFKNPVDELFEELEQKKPEHFAVRQYKKYKLAAGVT